jgi:hypothetical protein
VGKKGDGESEIERVGERREQEGERETTSYSESYILPDHVGRVYWERTLKDYRDVQTVSAHSPILIRNSSFVAHLRNRGSFSVT